MSDSIMYHDGNRRLQDRFDSRRISDRLEEKLTRRQFTSDDKAFIESAPYFFLATADAEGRPDCSFKGGMPGFVRVTGPSELCLSGLRWQRHVQKPRQYSGQFQRRAAVHCHAWQTPAPACERRGDGERPGSADGPDGCRPTHCPSHRTGNLPELSALHSDHAISRTVSLRAASWMRGARTGLEGL